MNRPVVIIGGGGHGKVLIDALLILGADIRGVADPSLRPEDSPFGVPVLGNDDAVLALAPNDILLVNGVGSIRSTAARDGIYQRFTSRGFHFASIIHPSATISPRAVLEAGCQVMAGAIVQCGARIGANCIVNTRASIDHDCVVGRSVHIAPGAVLCGNVTIGERSHIGSGAVIIQGIEIAPGTLVLAGAVITATPDGAEKMEGGSRRGA
jgi:UDP-perosamine 4-acetyltransferase